MKNKKMQHKCKLPAYKVEEISSLSDAQQKSGWGITAFNLPKAWEKTRGEGVKIAVLDSGCDLDHPDLIQNLLPGINIINSKLSPEDDCGHGTHATGIIVAENNDIGMVGVAPKAKVIPVKVLDKNGSGKLENVAKGIRWAVDNGADIITMSLGCPNPLATLRKSLQYAVSKNVPIFCAAGNAGLTKDVFYPAAYPETIAIGSIDEDFDRSKFSNTGTNLDFMAPGGKIFSTIPDNWYGIMSGTSMACPFGVGVAALLLSYKRNYNAKFPLNNIEDYRNAFRKNCIPINNKKYAGNEFFQGFGIIDPRKFLEWVDKHKEV